MTSKVDYRSKTDLVADAVRLMIQNGELPPGTELRQRDLAQLLGVSSTPVREALRRLEAEGYVANEPHRGTIVFWPEKGDIYETAVLRGMLEGRGAELAAKRVTASDLEQLRELNRRLIGSKDRAESLALDRQFHTHICEITGSSVLLNQLNLIWRALGDGAHIQIKLEQWARQHQVIIDALAAGDCSEAKAATKSHAMEGLEAYAPTD
jgi:DNA-binding GntR family transcriptional regulator